jgi:(1->4)-alpha-D-glucan 1-alpha-D-glucosylmutase
MTGEVENLCRVLHHVLTGYTFGRDITFSALKRALEELLVWFPVYRTYGTGEGFSDQDLACLREAFRRAREKAVGLSYELEFLEDYFLRPPEPMDEEERRVRTGAIMRFQQFTGPLMAKGFEDTFLYVYNRLLSLNEVGGSPGSFGIPLEEFHEFCRARSETWPAAMNATATHDTKRGEDVRARLNVLSEMPQQWERRLKAWSTVNARRRRTVRGRKVPDRNDEYMLYQTLVGAFPFRREEYGDFKERIKECMLKSVREAKVSSDWVNRNPEYEEAFLDYIDKLLPDSMDSPFLRDFLPFQQTVARYGMVNSLAQTLLKIAAPGVPDFYQGSELWDLNLVDPDNRRPVDYELRRRYLSELSTVGESGEPELVEGLLCTPEDGRIKLYLVHRLLHARRARPSLFGSGDYVPLQARGARAGNVAAFARRLGGSWAVAAAPRFPVSLSEEGSFPLGEVWGDTVIELPEGAPGAWRNVLPPSRMHESQELPAARVFGRFPAALLLSEE